MTEHTSGLRWYRGNVHTHTAEPPASDVHTDARTVAAWYRDHRYQFVVVTDHEHLTDVAPLNAQLGTADFLVLPGQEITQMVLDPAHPHGRRQAHVNAIGTDRLILPLGYPDFTGEELAVWRATPPGGLAALLERDERIAARFASYPTDQYTMAETFVRNVAAVRAAGGIAQINHPNLHWSVRRQDLEALDGVLLMEVANAFWAAGNLGGTDATGERTPSTEELWDELLTLGMVIWATAGDDAHDYLAFDDRDAPTPGKAWITVRAAQLTQAAIIESLARGDFYASTGIVLDDLQSRGDRYALTIGERHGWDGARFPAMPRYSTRFVGAGGRPLAEVSGTGPVYEIRGDEGYVRAVVRDSDGRTAWTQPVFLDDRLTRARSATASTT
ncbi:hypothetical protein [Dactylosporangium sp. CA-233914]|uniref:hypothetical protein n=1 Tax=Dactylosporangium sp. CA-233914 TaxID=3239934 RepID=UPI003D9115BA